MNPHQGPGELIYLNCVIDSVMDTVEFFFSN
jgi:hypothetical protein